MKDRVLELLQSGAKTSKQLKQELNLNDSGASLLAVLRQLRNSDQIVKTIVDLPNGDREYGHRLALPGETSENRERLPKIERRA